MEYTIAFYQGSNVPNLTTAIAMTNSAAFNNIFRSRMILNTAGYTADYVAFLSVISLGPSTAFMITSAPSTSPSHLPPSSSPSSTQDTLILGLSIALAVIGALCICHIIIYWRRRGSRVSQQRYLAPAEIDLDQTLALPVKLHQDPPQRLDLNNRCSEERGNCAENGHNNASFTPLFESPILLPSIGAFNDTARSMQNPSPDPSQIFLIGENTAHRPDSNIRYAQGNFLDANESSASPNLGVIKNPTSESVEVTRSTAEDYGPVEGLKPFAPFSASSAAAEDKELNDEMADKISLPSSPHRIMRITPTLKGQRSPKITPSQENDTLSLPLSSTFPIASLSEKGGFFNAEDQSFREVVPFLENHSLSFAGRPISREFEPGTAINAWDQKEFQSEVLPKTISSKQEITKWSIGEVVTVIGQKK